MCVHQGRDVEIEVGITVEEEEPAVAEALGELDRPAGPQRRGLHRKLEFAPGRPRTAPGRDVLHHLLRAIAQQEHEAAQPAGGQLLDQDVEKRPAGARCQGPLGMALT